MGLLGQVLLPPSEPMRIKTRPTVEGRAPEILPLSRIVRSDEVEDMQIGRSGVPVLVIRHGERFLLVDGNHRVAYRRRRGFKTIKGWILQPDDGPRMRGIMAIRLREFAEGKVTLEELTESLLAWVRQQGFLVVE